MSEIEAIIVAAVHASRNAGTGSDTEAKADVFELGARRALDGVIVPAVKALIKERDALKAENVELIRVLRSAEAEIVGLYKGIAPNGDFASRSEVVQAIRHILLNSPVTP